MSYYGHQPRTSSLPGTEAQEGSSGSSSSPNSRNQRPHTASRAPAPISQASSSRPQTAGVINRPNVYQEVLDSPLLMTAPGFSSSPRSRAFFQPHPISVPRLPRNLPTAVNGNTSSPSASSTLSAGGSGYDSSLAPAVASGASSAGESPKSSTFTTIRINRQPTSPNPLDSPVSMNSLSHKPVLQTRLTPNSISKQPQASKPKIEPSHSPPIKVIVSQHSPSTSQSSPSQSRPSHDRPRPSYERPRPSYERSRPSYERTRPSREKPRPSYERSSSGAQAPAPPPKDEQYLKPGTSKNLSPPSNRTPTSPLRLPSHAPQTFEVEGTPVLPVLPTPKTRRELPKLDVVIPDHGLDRFSVMFASVLEPSLDKQPPVPKLPSPASQAIAEESSSSSALLPISSKSAPTSSRLVSKTIPQTIPEEFSFAAPEKNVSLSPSVHKPPALSKPLPKPAPSPVAQEQSLYNGVKRASPSTSVQKTPSPSRPLPAVSHAPSKLVSKPASTPGSKNTTPINQGQRILTPKSVLNATSSPKPLSSTIQQTVTEKPSTIVQMKSNPVQSSIERAPAPLNLFSSSSSLHTISTISSMPSEKDPSSGKKAQSGPSLSISSISSQATSSTISSAAKASYASLVTNMPPLATKPSATRSARDQSRIKAPAHSNSPNPQPQTNRQALPSMLVASAHSQPVSLSLFPHIPNPHSASTSLSESRSSHERLKPITERTSTQLIPPSPSAFELEASPVDPSFPHNSREAFSAYIRRPLRDPSSPALSPMDSQLTEATLFPTIRFDTSRASSTLLPSASKSGPQNAVELEAPMTASAEGDSYDLSEALMPLPTPTVPTTPRANVHEGLTDDTRDSPQSRALAPAPLFHGKALPNLQGLSVLASGPVIPASTVKQPLASKVAASLRSPSASRTLRSKTSSGTSSTSEADPRYSQKTYHPVMETAYQMPMSRVVHESPAHNEAPSPSTAHHQKSRPKDKLPRQRYYQSDDSYQSSPSHRNATPTPIEAAPPPPSGSSISSTSSIYPSHIYSLYASNDYDTDDFQQPSHGAARAICVPHVPDERQRYSCGVEWGYLEDHSGLDLSI